MNALSLAFRVIIVSIQVGIGLNSNSQISDSINHDRHIQPAPQQPARPPKFPGQFILPAILIGAGSVDPGAGGPFNLNSYCQHQTQTHWKIPVSPIDDYMQYAAVAAVYSLDLLHVKPRHDFWERSKLYIGGELLVVLTTYSLKSITHVERPNHSDFRSFPSGHAATAFLGADFFYQEFRHRRKWWIYSGYIVATATGVYRVLNNQHWMTDIIAGAGFGILSNRLSYLVLDRKKHRSR